MKIAFKALLQVGPAPLFYLGLYRLGLISGVYRRWPLPAEPSPLCLPTREAGPPAASLKNLLDEKARAELLAQAESILAGAFRPFGGPPAPLRLDWPLPRVHWTLYARGQRKIDFAALGLEHPDIKFLWEPARFTWVFPLGRAFRLSGDARYAAAFWRYFELFDRANPPGQGIQWMNGQEVALRLLALVWADAVFAAAPASTSARRRRLAASVAEHARRIPPTLSYARAQNNNHLLSEAAALITAARVLPQHPAARRWQRLGQRWFDWGIRHQIDPRHGEYIQHSLTYHRLMLQLALWLEALHGLDFLSASARQRLRAASRWLAERVDAESGDAPNLGSNDGAYILPLAGGGFRDFRPVAQAACRAFASQDAFPPGPWDEMSLWLGLAPQKPASRPQTASGWRFYLRRAEGPLRLAHADLLHLDLWRQGQNLALDAGTYLYNGAPPWDNPWPPAFFHNTLTVDDGDQMLRGGRFLYLDWARAWTTQQARGRLCAETDAWRKLGLRHLRCVQVEGQALIVSDRILPRRGADARHRLRLHWLLKDAPFTWHSDPQAWTLSLQMPQGLWQLRITPPPERFSLVRAGQVLAGQEEAAMLRGWYAPTYGLKIPALSLACLWQPGLPFTITTRFSFPSERQG